MKTMLKLSFVSALIIMSGTLFAASPKDPANVTHDPEETMVVPMYFGEDVEVIKKVNRTIYKSELALENVMRDYENSIPPSLINQSEGIVIFPRALKIALGTAGGQGGNGIAMIRLEDGTWSNPFIVTLGEASIGCQIGIQKSDIVLLFKNRNDIMGIDEADIILGAGIGVVAGPVGKEAATTKDINFEAEIYSYQHSKGLFVGFSVRGGVLSFNNKYNETLYCWNNVTPDNIFHELEAPYNDDVNDLIETLNMYGE